MANGFDILLAALVLWVAFWTILARDTFTSVIAFVSYGLLLALVWVRIAAPDVALTEAAIGSGVTGSLLILASTRLLRAGVPADGERPGPSLRACAAVLCAGIAAALAAVVVFLPQPPPTLAPLAATALPTTTLGNPVAAVLIAFRAVDTLLESVVLVLAVLGVWSLAPDLLWGGTPGRRRRADAGSPLTLLARFLPPLGIVIGLHVFWLGSKAPGGEFQGSAILAAMWILAIVAGLVTVPAISRISLRLIVVLGPVVFLAVGFAGFAVPGDFLAYPPNATKPLILLVEIALMISIATMLGLLVVGPPHRRERP